MIATLDKVLHADKRDAVTADADVTYFYSVHPERNYLTAEDDPVLAELWDNPFDAAAYDEEETR